MVSVSVSVLVRPGQSVAMTGSSLGGEGKIAWGGGGVIKKKYGGGKKKKLCSEM